MLQTYKAILKGDRLEWSGDAPEQVSAEQGIEVYVIILRDAGVASEPTSDGKAMAEALAKIAASGSLSEFPGPANWQREQRRDRELPGRDG